MLDHVVLSTLRVQGGRAGVRGVWVIRQSLHISSKSRSCASVRAESASPPQRMSVRPLREARGKLRRRSARVPLRSRAVGWL